MLLTVSKRLEFSASRRLFDPKLSEAENRAQFGEESAARYGTGETTSPGLFSPAKSIARPAC